ncbi:NADPH-dependent FMN reductase [Muricauda sp. ANG21]|uniref:NADPH-dependent FMN reductase n=1 Tax=Allomuricauda sp. ANG21 TaxID=3042468 RepID=UPI003454FDCA
MRRIIAFTGSNNPNSIHEKWLRHIIAQHPKEGIEFLDLKAFNVPIYSQGIEELGIPQKMRALFQVFSEADGFIIASPEHNGLPSAFLKNIIDWLSRIDQRFFGEKPILLLSTSPGVTGGRTHLNLLAGLVGRWGGELAGQYSLGSFHQNFDMNQNVIVDPEVRIQMRSAISALLNNKKLLSTLS